MQGDLNFDLSWDFSFLYSKRITKIGVCLAIAKVGGMPIDLGGSWQFTVLACSAVWYDSHD